MQVAGCRGIQAEIERKGGGSMILERHIIRKKRYSLQDASSLLLLSSSLSLPPSRQVENPQDNVLIKKDKIS